MKALDCSQCLVHVFVCVNERPEPRTGCRDFGGQEFYISLKDKLKETGLIRTHWISRTRCLGFCQAVGTTVMIQPTGKDAQWYSEATADDFPRIWEAITSH